jgi:DNA-binding SARP family transcriptional activator
MQALVAALQTENLHMYSALAHHNLAVARLAHADPDAALKDAQAALGYLELIDEDDGTAASTKVAIAHCHFEKADFLRATTWRDAAVGHPGAQPDALAEAALLHLWTGSLGRAVTVADQASMVLKQGGHQATSSDALQCLASFLSLAGGNASQAAVHAQAARATFFDPNQGGLILTARAAAAVAAGSNDARAIAEETLEELDRRRVRRWFPHARLLRSIACGDLEQVLHFFSGPQDQLDCVLLVVADVFERVLGRLDTPPPALQRHVLQWPLRWRPILRRALADGSQGSGLAAAALLAEIGDESDAHALRQWERQHKKWVYDSRYSVRLARRISPTLLIRDLGKTVLTLGDRDIPITGVRRRAASLLLFLVSRPRQTATREQVLDALWPEMDPVAAGNSLHQTLFFLRRELVEHPKGQKPLVEYVPVGGDIVQLVPELVHVDSVAFLRQANEVSTKRPESPEALALVQAYGGTFAPEFEYDEWAIHWRDHLHSVFLGLAERAARARLPGRAAEATAILRHSLEVDPSALELKALLAGAMYMAGSHAAARVLYQQYSSEALSEFGEQPPPLAHLLSQLGNP